MSLQQVNVGTIPNDGTGDDPRTGISKINDNFSDTANMAALLAQTSGGDTSPNKGITTNTFQPFDPDGFGMVRRMRNNSGGTVITGGTIDGSDLAFGEQDITGAWTDVAVSVGIYVNVTKAAIGNGKIGSFVRSS